MNYYTQYVQLLQKAEQRTSRGSIRPRNIYKLSVYKDGDPSSSKRLVFVIGKVGDSIHTLKLNEIKPIDFANFLYKLRDKRVPVDPNLRLENHLIKTDIQGKRLFESYIKPNRQIYGGKNNHYRVYKLDKIQYIAEIKYENDVLRNIFRVGTETQRRVDITEEIQEKDG